MQIRPRRNRRTPAIREMVRETRLSVDQLIYPLFLVDGSHQQIPITAMPGIHRFSIDKIFPEIEDCLHNGLHNFILFPVVEASLKDKKATYSYHKNNFYLKAIRAIKEHFPEVCLVSDVAMDPYSSDGHDGYVNEQGFIENDKTLSILALMSLAQAEAGIDILGPSDMMDGRVGFIRGALDEAGYTDTAIMSYTAKYASAFYGPFREALDSAPKSGDKKTYQMDPANKWEALREAALDEAEGADFLMVKPALAYLDVIHVLKENFSLPIAAYNVSGEYAMIHAAAQKGWLNLEKATDECLLSIARAGADVILTYFAKNYAERVLIKQ